MQPQRRRHNGWTWPPSFLQLFFWVAIPVVASSTAFLVMPVHALYAPLAVFIGAFWLILQIIVLTCIDPAVSNLQKDQAPAYFDASKHEHVIENLFCNICLINVLFLLLVLSVSFISAITSICLIVIVAISFINIGLLSNTEKLPIKVMLWRGLCFAASVPYSIVAVLCAHLLYFHYKLCQSMEITLQNCLCNIINNRTFFILEKKFITSL
ncbi:hypothetical protein X798_00527, partial [Onchocerca flexuosa]